MYGPWSISKTASPERLENSAQKRISLNLLPLHMKMRLCWRTGSHGAFLAFVAVMTTKRICISRDGNAEHELHGNLSYPSKGGAILGKLTEMEEQLSICICKSFPASAF
jgi:hypothetical protein